MVGGHAGYGSNCETGSQKDLELGLLFTSHVALDKRLWSQPACSPVKWVTVMPTSWGALSESTIESNVLSREQGLAPSEPGTGNSH